MATYDPYENRSPAYGIFNPGPTTSGANPSGRDEAGAYSIWNPAPGQQPGQGFDWSGTTKRSLKNKRRAPPQPTAQPATAPQPEATAPAPQPTQPAGPGPYDWMDVSQPGYAERRYEETDWNAPNALNQYWQGLQGAFAPGQFNDIQSNFGAYYDRQRDKAAAASEKYFGGMGLTGSTAQGNAMANAFADIGAEEARAETDFDMALRNQKLNYMMGGGQLAGSVAGADRADRVDAFNAAMAAQRAREGRIGDFFDRSAGQNRFDAEFFGRGMGGIFDTDTESLDREIEAYLGKARAGYDVGRQGRSDKREDLATLISIIEAGRGLGGGSGTLGGGGRSAGTDAFDKDYLMDPDFG